MRTALGWFLCLVLVPWTAAALRKHAVSRGNMAWSGVWLGLHHSVVTLWILASTGLVSLWFGAYVLACLAALLYVLCARSAWNLIVSHVLAPDGRINN